MNKYDAIFIFLTKVREEMLDKVLSEIEAEIKAVGGSVDGKVIMGKRMFARPLKKHDMGRYVKIRFSLEPSAVDDLLARMKLNENVFRVQINRANLKKEVNSNVNPE